MQVLQNNQGGLWRCLESSMQIPYIWHPLLQTQTFLASFSQESVSLHFCFSLHEPQREIPIRQLPKTIASHTLFPISQGSLYFMAWYPLSEIHILCPVFFVILIRRYIWSPSLITNQKSSLLCFLLKVTSSENSFLLFHVSFQQWWTDIFIALDLGGKISTPSLATGVKIPNFGFDWTWAAWHQSGDYPEAITVVWGTQVLVGAAHLSLNAAASVHSRAPHTRAESQAEMPPRR